MKSGQGGHRAIVTARGGGWAEALEGRQWGKRLRVGWGGCVDQQWEGAGPCGDLHLGTPASS